MKKYFLTCIFLLAFSMPAFARLEVITTYPYIQDITQRMGQEKVKVEVMAQGNWDPHVVIPKPSLIAKARKANLLIINGAQLEIGWLPQIIRQANNPHIQTGTPGFLDLSSHISLIDTPSSASRAQGDVHPQGNPHFVLDPYNVPKIAKVIADQLSQLDSGNRTYYQANQAAFSKEWMTRLNGWNSQMKALSGTKVIEYHRLFDYFFRRYHLSYVGALEPLPGIPPTARHLEEMVQKAKAQQVKFIFQDVYHSQKAAQFVAGKTGARVVVMPQDVRAVNQVKDIFSLFDYMIQQLTK